MKEHEITSLDELESACIENRLMTLKGFGVKTQQTILDQLAFIKDNNGYFLWQEADQWKQTLETVIHQNNQDLEFEIAWVGDYAMQNAVLNQLECIISVPLDVLEQSFQESNIENYEIDNDGLILLVTNEKRQTCCFYYQNEHTFYNKVFESNSSLAFLEQFQNKYTIPATINSESDIFECNSIPFIPPYLRHNAHILDTQQLSKIDTIIQENDIKGIIHCHSTWSDGINTLKDMALEAKRQGMEYLMISDHSQTAAYANGLTIDKVKQQHAEIDLLNQSLAPFKIFKSIESDILNDGSLDYPNEILDLFDIVIASVHSNLNMDKAKATQRILKAISNPYTSIIGHPSGRLLLSRKGYDLDYETIIESCSTNNVVIELNANPKRLDIDWEYLASMQQKGLLTSINPDAHSIAQIAYVKYGVLIAQKAMLHPKSNLSSFTLQEIEQFIEQQKQKRN